MAGIITARPARAAMVPVMHTEKFVEAMFQFALCFASITITRMNCDVDN